MTSLRLNQIVVLTSVALHQYLSYKKSNIICTKYELFLHENSLCARRTYAVDFGLWM